MYIVNCRRWWYSFSLFSSRKFVICAPTSTTWQRSVYTSVYLFCLSIYNTRYHLLHRNIRNRYDWTRYNKIILPIVGYGAYYILTASWMPSGNSPGRSVIKLKIKISMRYLFKQFFKLYLKSRRRQVGSAYNIRYIMCNMYTYGLIDWVGSGLVE